MSIGTLTSGACQEAADRLPEPTVDKLVLDLEGSYVADRDEGFINKFQGSDLERDAQLKAVEQMTAAGSRGDTLTKLAKDNTTSMLKGLFGSLGCNDVTITFEGDALRDREVRPIIPTRHQAA